MKPRTATARRQPQLLGDEVHRTRRRVVAAASVLGAVFALPGRAAGAPGAGAAPPTQTATATPDAARAAFMARAFDMRRLAVERGDQAFGAVVVKDGAVVGEGVSAVVTAPDPTAHGEIQAIRDAARRLRTARLDGCELYTTFRPCPMCEAAAAWAGIARVYYGETMSDGGTPRLTRC